MDKYNLNVSPEHNRNQNLLYDENDGKKAIIEALVIGGKVWVECTKLRPWAKVTINLGIDVFAECLKNATLSDIEKIRIAAKRFNLDKVVSVPLGSWCGKDIVVIRAYGYKAEGFIKHLGLHLIPEIGKNDFINCIRENENNFGVVIYQKKQLKS